MKKIKVLHVINSFEPGGIEIQLLEILRHYDREKFKMDICAVGHPKGDLLGEFKLLADVIIHCPKSPNLWRFANNFAGLIIQRHYDVVHSHFEAWSGPLLWGARSAGVNIRLAQIHSSHPWAFDKRDKLHVRLAQKFVLSWGRWWVGKCATSIIAVSDSVKERVHKWNMTIPMDVWCAGVDLERFQPNLECRRPHRIICVGGLLEAKHHEHALDILTRVKQHQPGVELLIVGAGPMRNYLEKRCYQLGLKNRVNFLGKRRDISELLNSSALLLSCSEVEGLPTIFLEAQACGLPIVATDIPPHLEALVSQLHSYTFPLGDLDGAARNVLKVIQNPKIGLQLSKPARKFVETKFDSRRQTKKLENLYLENSLNFEYAKSHHRNNRN